MVAVIDMNLVTRSDICAVNGLGHDVSYSTRNPLQELTEVFRTGAVIVAGILILLLKVQ